MQIGSECFKDEQLCYMIESAQKLGRCDITGRDNCFVYDTDKDFYLKEYIEELIDVFTVAKYMGVDEADDRVAYISTFYVAGMYFLLMLIGYGRLFVQSVSKDIMMSLNYLMRK